MDHVDESQPLITHLVELRNRLLRCVICVAVIFVGLVYFSNDIYHFVASPLTEVMPKGATMIATNIQTPFFTPIKLTAIVSVFISVPYLLYQVWAFIAPALYQHEKRMIYPLLFSSTILFIVVLPLPTMWYFLLFSVFSPKLHQRGWRLQRTLAVILILR
ncbi:Sec-independent protein translocase protein TatC [Rodentibacter pneumotropicus]|uniref:Sec-independent protein translocase protein TatC n=1 Tax=Rodentibacter pneumotropicus TaxID=758 RepID=A0A448MTD6_9PAST|nr:Sec-independent protein translocase protein TatC [Rodentibacter pneumotropicus]